MCSKTRHQYLTGLLLFLVSQGAQAELDFYAGVDAQFSSISINNETFTPSLMRFNGGVWLREGVGVEGMLGTSLSDDSAGSLQIDVPSLLSLSVRLQSPEDMNTKAYALLGYSHYELEGSLGNDSGFPGSEPFTGPAVALGFLRQTGFIENVSAYLELTGYFADEDIDFSGVSVGLRYGY